MAYIRRFVCTVRARHHYKSVPLDYNHLKTRTRCMCAATIAEIYFVFSTVAASRPNAKATDRNGRRPPSRLAARTHGSLATRPSSCQAARPPSCQATRPPTCPAARPPHSNYWVFLARYECIPRCTHNFHGRKTPSCMTACEFVYV